MVNSLWVNADHGGDFRPLANHMTQLRNFTKGDDFTRPTFKGCTNE